MIIIVITMTRQPLIIRLQLLTIRPTKLTTTTNHILIPFFLFLYLVTTIILQIKINRFYCRFYSISINLFALIEFWVWLYVWEWYITAFLVLWGEGWLVFMVGGILSLSAACFIRLICYLIVIFIFIIVVVVIITRLTLTTKPSLWPYHTILTFLLLVVIFHQ